MPTSAPFDADEQHALGGADVQHDPPARPAGRDLELALVDARSGSAAGGCGGRPGQGIWTFV